MTTSSVTKTELTNADIDRLMDEGNERDAANGSQEPGDEIEAAAGEGEGDQRRAAPEPEKVEAIPMSPQDAKRQAMADRFKRPDVEERPFDGDMTKAENLYGDVATETLVDDETLPQPGVPAGDRQQEPLAQPRMITRTVRGKEVTRSEDEWLALAMKVDAADTYLDESRQLLEDAKAIREGRAAPDRQHPDGQTQARDDGQDRDDHQTETRRPGIDLKAVVEEIQFGDPAVAAEKLAQAIDNVATKQVNEGHIKRLVDNDRARSKLDLKAFTEKYADLAQDQLASNLIENLVYSIYREEIQKQGVDEAQIPKNPNDLAEWHRLYRVHGHPVSKPADVLEAAKARFDKWRGVSEQPKPAPRKGEARVEVNVDRTERRMAIPVQPSRAVAPRRDAPVVKQEDSRKAAVQEMRRARNQPVV